MKIVQFFLLFALWLGSDALMGFTKFNDKIKTNCFKTNDQLRDENRQRSSLPRSIEAFIGLVERLERYPKKESPRLNTMGVVRELLMNFRYDDVDFDDEDKGFSTRGKTDVSLAHDLTQNIFRDQTSSFNMEELFNVDERCALFYMISHTTDTNFRMNEESETLLNKKREAKYPLEHGVLSVASDQSQAFSIGKVLLGILAGIKAQSVRSSEIYAQMKTTSQPPPHLEDDIIDPIYAATFGDIIAVPYAEGQKKGDLLMQSAGYWKDISCPTEYLLDGINRDKHATAALIRGAIDGYAIGKKLNTLFSKNGSLKLSQILRIFYSGDSFPDTPVLSACSRSDLWTEAKQTLTEEARSYQALYMELTGTSADNKDSLISDYCNKAIGSIQSLRPKLFDERVESACSASAEGGEVRKETPRDVLAIFDNQADELKKQVQREIIGNMSSGFDMNEDGSSVSVFSNLRSSSSQLLDSIINGSHVSGCSSCAIKYYEPLGASADGVTEIVKRLNRTLAAVTEENSQKSGVPAKVILYFNYQSSVGMDHQMRQAIWELQYNFREASLFAIGLDSSNLKEFVRDKQIDVFTPTAENSEALIKQLQTRVQKVPAQFQYNLCDRQDGSQEGQHIGYISPHRSQYWAMYPKYFLKSYKILLTFKVDSGTYKVCYSRNYGEIMGTGRPREDLCKEVNPSTPFLREVDNPCKKRDLQTCDPFYFYLEGKTAPDKPCENLGCMNPKQIQFIFTHKGVSCNSASSLSAAFILSIFLSFLLIFHQRKM